jgi:hypothetical protein
MATTTYFDATFAVRSMNARTDSAGTPVTDLTAEEDRLSHEFTTQGWVLEPLAFAPTEGLVDTMNLAIGSPGARTDYYLVPGDAEGQGKYVVRLAARVNVLLDSADPSLPRKDEVYLVVEDNIYDSNARSLARLGYRTGTPAVTPLAPGADAGWNAYALLATVTIPAGAPDIAATTIVDERAQSQLVVDAATLDGHTSAYFSTAGHAHAGDYAPIAHEGDTVGHPEATPSAAGFLDSADKSKLDGIEAGAEVNPSAVTLRNQINAVDGPGSGLDADLLDGTSAAGLATAGHNHNAEHYTESESNSQLTGKRNKVQGTFLRTGGFTGTGTSGLLQELAIQIMDRNDWGGGPTIPAPPGAGTAHVNPKGAGLYLLYGQVIFGANSSGFRQIELSSEDGGVLAIVRKPPIIGDSTIVQIQAIYLATDNLDTLHLHTYYTGGGSLLMGSDSFFKVIALEL